MVIKQPYHETSSNVIIHDFFHFKLGCVSQINQRTALKNIIQCKSVFIQGLLAEVQPRFSKARPWTKGHWGQLLLMRMVVSISSARGGCLRARKRMCNIFRQSFEIHLTWNADGQFGSINNVWLAELVQVSSIYRMKFWAQVSQM